MDEVYLTKTLSELCAGISSLKTSVAGMDRKLDGMTSFGPRLAVLEDNNKSRKLRDRVLWGSLLAVGGKLLYDLIIIIIAVV